MFINATNEKQHHTRGVTYHFIGKRIHDSIDTDISSDCDNFASNWFDYVWMNGLFCLGVHRCVTHNRSYIIAISLLNLMLNFMLVSPHNVRPSVLLSFSILWKLNHQAYRCQCGSMRFHAVSCGFMLMDWNHHWNWIERNTRANESNGISSKSHAIYFIWAIVIGCICY